jgi:hypothetical protein
MGKKKSNSENESISSRKHRHEKRTKSKRRANVEDEADTESLETSSQYSSRSHSRSRRHPKSDTGNVEEEETVTFATTTVEQEEEEEEEVQEPLPEQSSSLNQIQWYERVLTIENPIPDFIGRFVTPTNEQRDSMSLVEACGFVQKRMALMYFGVVLAFAIRYNIWEYVMVFAIQELILVSLAPPTVETFTASSAFCVSVSFFLVGYALPPILFLVVSNRETLLVVTASVLCRILVPEVYMGFAFLYIILVLLMTMFVNRHQFMLSICRLAFLGMFAYAFKEQHLHL